MNFDAETVNKCTKSDSYLNYKFRNPARQRIPTITTYTSAAYKYRGDEIAGKIEKIR